MAHDPHRWLTPEAERDDESPRDDPEPATNADETSLRRNNTPHSAHEGSESKS